MKLLIYTEYFFPTSGGVQTVVLDLARGVAEWSLRHPDEAFEVLVVTNTPDTPSGNATFPFAVIRRPGFLSLVRLIAQSDLIHLAGPAILPLFLALLLRKRVVVEHHGFHVACPNGLLFYEPDQTPCPGHFMARHPAECWKCNRATMGPLGSLKQILLTYVRRWLSNRVFANIMPTAWLGTVVRLRRSRTVHHGLDEGHLWTPADTSPNVSTFAYQGRLVTTKGVDLLVRAAERLRKQGALVQLKIVGDGPERENLKRLAGETGVEFLGHVPDEQLAECLAKAATVVVPSLAGEVFGLVVAENMFRGKLLIVSDIGALREVAGDNALVFPTGDIDALGACMRQVMRTPDLIHTLGPAAHSRAQELFGLDRMIRSHVALYQEAALR